LHPAGVLPLARPPDTPLGGHGDGDRRAGPLRSPSPLHRLRFAALHLACMRLISVPVPPYRAATVQGLYRVCAGAASALSTLAAGRLYADLGARASGHGAALWGRALTFAVAVARLRNDHNGVRK
jgi:hypothetical protein